MPSGDPGGTGPHRPAHISRRQQLIRSVRPADTGALTDPGTSLNDLDRGTVTAARISASGSYLMYMNATPRQGTESLRNWAAFRVRHLLDDDASAARVLAESQGVRFIGGTGSCVMDDYVTRAKARKYTELACFVQGHAGASVIVAAAPTALWPRVSSVLARAVGAYRIR